MLHVVRDVRRRRCCAVRREECAFLPSAPAVHWQFNRLINAALDLVTCVSPGADANAAACRSCLTRPCAAHAACMIEGSMGHAVGRRMADRCSRCRIRIAPADPCACRTCLQFGARHISGRRRETRRGLQAQARSGAVQGGQYKIPAFRRVKPVQARWALTSALRPREQNGNALAGSNSCLLRPAVRAPRLSSPVLIPPSSRIPAHH